jgi:hypothetical protein
MAAESPGPQHAAALRAQLDGLGLPEEEIEIEREMLEGLERIAELARLDAADLPALVTGHRIVGADVCHFTAPASMPDDPAQPSGRLLLTSARAIFLGGAKGVTVPWHAVAEPRQSERDLLLIRTDREALHRFRCNSFADAMAGAFIARRLAAAAGRAKRVPSREA